MILISKCLSRDDEQLQQWSGVPENQGLGLKTAIKG